MSYQNAPQGWQQEPPRYIPTPDEAFDAGQRMAKERQS